MDLARYVVDAVVVQGRSYREVAAVHGVSKSYVGKLMGRFRDGGYEAIAPRSRAPGHVPHRTPDAIEDAIVALRKELGDRGLDAGALTIHYHLGTRHQAVPSVSTIWRVLRRRGFVTPQPLPPGRGGSGSLGPRRHHRSCGSSGRRVSAGGCRRRC